MPPETETRTPASKSTYPFSCTCVGGGMAGLTLAKILRQHGIQTTVLDKGRGIGGRMATRRIPPEGVFDYGAQYFTARDPKFQAWVAAWKTAGTVTEWSQGFRTADGSLKANGEPRYRGVPNMRSIAKSLADPLWTFTASRVTKVTWEETFWTAEIHPMRKYRSDVMVFTQPIPQALELLDQSQIQIPSDIRGELETIAYHPCIAVLALLENLAGKAPVDIPEPGGMWLNGDPLSWIADNGAKGVSSAEHTVTLHAGPEFSQSHWEADDKALIQTLMEAASPWVTGEVVKAQVHRWRYSQPYRFYSSPFLSIDLPGTLVFAGDAFVEANVEGAVLSGMAAAEFILSQNR